MAELTKEWLLKTITELEEERDDVPGVVNEDAANALAAMKLALASLEAEKNAEPVAKVETVGVCWYADNGVPRKPAVGTELYTAPPAPVSVPDAIHSQGEKSASDDYYALGWNACRAAMLQGAEPVTTAYKLPFEQWLSQQTGAIDVECGCVMTEVFLHWLRVAYEAGNSPVIPDGWVACSERMPSAGEQVLAYRPDAPESNDPLIKMATYVGGSAHGHGFDCYCKPTHWMPLPAAPQQEVK